MFILITRPTHMSRHV